jgi:hypothetical protein
MPVNIGLLAPEVKNAVEAKFESFHKALSH